MFPDLDLKLGHSSFTANAEVIMVAYYLEHYYTIVCSLHSHRNNNLQ